MAKLTTKQRDKLKDSDFAVPGKRKLPIFDASHCRAAWDFLPRTKGLTDSEIKEARKRILARAKEFNIDTSDWEKKKVSKEGFVELSLESMTPVQRRIRSLIMDTDDIAIDGLTVSDEGFREWINLHPGLSLLAYLTALVVMPIVTWPVPVAALITYAWQRQSYREELYKWAKKHDAVEDPVLILTSEKAFKAAIREYIKYLKEHHEKKSDEHKK